MAMLDQLPRSPQSVSANANTQILPPGAQKFFIPTPPAFSRFASILSVLSLLLFAIASGAVLVTRKEWPLWVLAPFAATAFGATVGFFYELALILAGRPYQLLGSKVGRFVQAIRAGNLSLVVGSVSLAYVAVTFGSSENVVWFVAVIGALTGWLLITLFFQGPPQVALALITAHFAGQILLVLLAPELNESLLAMVFLGLAAGGLYATTFIGARTPWRSTIFHLVAVFVVGWLFLGFHAVENLLSPLAGPPLLRRAVLFIAFLGGVLLAFRLMPMTWGVLRSHIANAIWPLFYLVIAGGARIPRPERLGELYRGSEHLLKPLSLLPYHIGHPRALTHAISVPCLDEALTLKVHRLGFITQLVKLVFGLASLVNQLFPFANIDVELRNKPRMEPWSDGSDYWPRWLLKKIYLPRLGYFSIQSGVRGPGAQPTPQMAIEAYKRGQLLAYMVEYGAAGSFLTPGTYQGDTCFVLDFSFLEKYETKLDYEPYGGTAYFTIDEDKQTIRLAAVRAPRSTTVLEADPTDATFRHAEDMILASLYYYVVSGKHLVEIHMGLNLVEVALFNSFDAKQRWDHPVRLALYPHLFAHELAEELTTQNLLEDKAVFPQIFATTNAALMRHLNDRFSEYELARDEDFESRIGVMLTGNEDKTLTEILPRFSLVWELRFAAIWQQYADRIVNATYPDDTAVSADACVQLLAANLSAIFPRPLPARYDAFQTRRGLSRFISDTMHHLIIRHEIYGTSAVRLALDPRINKVQVPTDGGTYAIDEWRSLACVAMATSRVRYTLLSTDFRNVFDDLPDASLRQQFYSAHDEMKQRLDELQKEFESDGVDNYETLRLLPDELDIGAGY